MKKAVRDIITGKTFDNGVLCSSENSVVADAAIAEEVKREFVAQGGVFLSADGIAAVGKLLVTPQRLPNPAVVGKTATYVAEQAGLSVPPTTRVLIAELAGVGRDYPLSIEKLCPVLSFYVVRDWREGCERCIQILRYGGMGHTMSIHSRNDEIILQFGLKKPAFRIVVNTPTTLGSIGLTTGLDPAMTLGCGGYGGNITSDNISPRHLLNIKRLAYEITPAVPRGDVSGDEQRAAAAEPRPVGVGASAGGPRPLPKAPEPPASTGLSAESLTERIDQFLVSRGYRGSARSAPAASSASSPAAAAAPADFVCEDDVRQAIQAGRKILIGERTIITPAARDLGEQKSVFQQASWR